MKNTFTYKKSGFAVSQSKLMRAINPIECLKVIAISLVFISLAPLRAQADTSVKIGDLDYGGTWNKEGSPYILDEGIRIGDGYTLNIEAGATVKSVYAVNPDYGYKPDFLTMNGSNLNINGTKDSPVVLVGLNNIYVSNSGLYIKNAILDGSSISLYRSTSTISNTVIKNTGNGIFAKGSRLNIDRSKLIDNKYGILSKRYSPIFQANAETVDGEDTPIGIGGMGNVLDGMTDATNTLDPLQNIISITNSNIVGNTTYGIYNETSNSINAEDDWWGDVNGPNWDSTDYNSQADKVYGLVNFTPWRDKEVNDVVCCSNVLFLPGIEASRLYKDGKILSKDDTNQLWEPNRNADVEKLYLDKTGKSIDSSIYTSDIIDQTVFGWKKIYKNLIAMMDGVVADKQINQWLPFPYDWRMDIKDVVYGETKLATSSVYLIKSVEDLAKSSKTGKVTIVAHSNGGLVAKMLMHALEEKNESNIVEKLILVATPELGTPKSILAMLNGYDQDFAGGLVLSENTARTFSKNMPGAYGLLPSKKFFEMNPIKVISDTFSSNKDLVALTYEKMKDFLLGNIFSKNTSINTNVPLLLNSSLVKTADSMHSIIDSWKPASTTKTISLIGWGLPTAKGVKYIKEVHCVEGQIFPCPLKYLPDLDLGGDGTVLTSSNASTSDLSLFFNLKRFDKDTKQEIDHADILQSSEALNVVKKQISNPDPDNDYGKYISTTKPIDTDKLLTIKVFSPVDIDIYDKEGNHTGLKENFDPRKESENYETGIPSSYYLSFSDTKMVLLPYGEDYQIVLKGNNVGPFIIQADVQQFGNVIASTTFREMPATTLTNVEMILSTSTDTFATSSVMNMDMDGDGITDFVNHTDEYLHSTSTTPISDYPTYIESMRKVILALKLSSKDEKKWIDRINKIYEKINKKNPRKIERIVKKLLKNRFKTSSLSEAQKTSILKTFDEMLNSLDFQIGK